MRLKAIYAGPRPVVSVEFFPPRTPETLAKFEADLAAFKALKPSFCSLTMGAGGSATAADQTVALVIRLKREIGFETMCHITCIGKSLAEIRRLLGDLAAGGVENVIALRGDPPKGQTEWKPHPEGFKHSVELVREAKTDGRFGIAVAGFPEVHPEAVSPQADLDYLKAKVDAGAEVVITQLFLDNDDFLRFRDRAVAAGVTVPIVPGLLPIRSVPWVRKFLPLCGAKLPADLEARLVKVEADEAAVREVGVEWATAQGRGLLAAGVAGLHVCCLNDPVPAGRVLRNLGLAA